MPKQKLNPAQKQKLSRKRVMVIGASILGLAVALTFIFNIGNVRSGFSATNAGVTYYAVTDGEWDSIGTWSTSANGRAANAYPVDGDIVIIQGHTVKVAKADAACYSATLQDGGSTLNISNGHQLSVSGGMKLIASAGKGDATLNLWGTNTKLNVALDLNGTVSGGQGNVAINTYNNSVITATYNLYLISQTGSSGTATYTMRNSSQLSTGSLYFNSTNAAKCFMYCYNTSMVSLRGTITRQDKSAKYGSLRCTDSSTIYLKGSAQQSITAATGGDTMYMQNLLIRNTNATIPQVTLNGNVNIMGNLNVTSGIVKTSASAMFIMGANATGFTGSATCHVSGPMRKDGKTAFVFPIGKNGVYAPIGISAPSISTTFAAEYFNSAYSNIKSADAAIKTVSDVEYWYLNRTPASAVSTTVTLYWSNGTNSKITSPSDLKVANFSPDKSGWLSAGNTAYTNKDNAGSVSSSPTTSFGFLTFGSTKGINPLPVSLIRFDAKSSANKIAINWATATEIDNDYFSIERSQDGTNFTEIGTVKGHGNSNSILEYNYTDESPLTGTSYYRLKQTDFNGKFERFAVKAVSMGAAAKATIESVSPNPFSDHFNVEYSVPNDAEANIQLMNISGSTMFEETVHANKGNNTYRYNDSKNLRVGTYILRISINGVSTVYKLIKN